MKEFLVNIDEKKLDIIIDVKDRFEEGKITLEQAQNELLERVKEVTASEIALIEQEIKSLDDKDCLKVDIQEMVAMFDKVRKPVMFELEQDHPIKSYLLENEVLKEEIEKLNALINKEFSRDEWEKSYNVLLAHKIHFTRKQNQLYSELEKRGFDRPSKIMWTLDDYIRDEINEGYKLLKDGKVEELIAFQKTLNADIIDLIGKEEDILYPTSLDMLTEEEFRKMRLGDDEIGYANIEAPTAFLPKESDSFKDELSELLKKHGYSKDEKELKVAEGLLSLDQINLMFKHLPVDFSFVDENDKVRFYSDSPHRVFPRSKSAIGRDVKNCHPQKSVHIVEEIIKKFKSGEQSKAEFWIDNNGVFIYILYLALRDEDGKYRGILEMMQDVSHIRTLKGSQTLLNWEKEERNEKEESEMKITKDTLLKDILSKDASIKEKLIEYNSAYQLLNTPLAKVMVPKATVEMIAAKGDVEIDELIAKLEEWLG